LPDRVLTLAQNQPARAQWERRQSYHAAIRRQKATANYELPAILVDDYSLGPEPGL